MSKIIDITIIDVLNCGSSDAEYIPTTQSFVNETDATTYIDRRTTIWVERSGDKRL